MKPWKELHANRHDEHHQEPKDLDLAVDLDECRCTGREWPAEGEAKQPKAAEKSDKGDKEKKK